MSGDGDDRWAGQAELGFVGPLVGLITLPFYALAAFVVGLVLGLRLGWALRRAVAPCPRGHPVELAGSWECGTCGLVFPGHAFGPCPEGHRDHAVQCACGLHVISPVSPLRVPW